VTPAAPRGQDRALALEETGGIATGTEGGEEGLGKPQRIGGAEIRLETRIGIAIVIVIVIGIVIVEREIETETETGTVTETGV